MNVERRAAVETGPAPIALHAGEGEALWFLGALVTMKASRPRREGLGSRSAGRHFRR